MSVHSDAAKKHIKMLLHDEYLFDAEDAATSGFPDDQEIFAQYPIELDGGTFQRGKSGHTSGVGLRTWREKNNAAMSAGWRVWHYAPEEVIKAGRKIKRGFFHVLVWSLSLFSGDTLFDEPILKAMPWLEKRTI